MWWICWTATLWLLYCVAVKHVRVMDSDEKLQESKRAKVDCHENVIPREATKVTEANEKEVEKDENLPESDTSSSTRGSTPDQIDSTSSETLNKDENVDGDVDKYTGIYSVSFFKSGQIY